MTVGTVESSGMTLPQPPRRRVPWNAPPGDSISLAALRKRWRLREVYVRRIPRTELPYEERRHGLVTLRYYRRADVDAYETKNGPISAVRRRPAQRDSDRDAAVRAMRASSARPTLAAIGNAFGIGKERVRQILVSTGGDPSRTAHAQRTRAAVARHWGRTLAARETHHMRAAMERKVGQMHTLAFQCDRIIEGLRTCVSRDGTVPTTSSRRFRASVGYTGRDLVRAFGSLNRAFRTAGVPMRSAAQARQSPAEPRRAERERRWGKALATREAQRMRLANERKLVDIHGFALHCDRIIEALRACVIREGRVPSAHRRRFRKSIGYTVSTVQWAFGSLNRAFWTSGVPARPCGPARTPSALAAWHKRPRQSRRHPHRDAEIRALAAVSPRPPLARIAPAYGLTPQRIGQILSETRADSPSSRRLQTQR
jgi:hypothetical protein